MAIPKEYAETNYVDVGMCEPKRALPIVEQRQRVEKSIVALSDVISRLEDRLDPLLNNERAEDGLCGTSCCGESQLALWLGEMASGIMAKHDRLMDLIDRLEL